MRKLMDFVILWCLFCGVAFGQAADPQNTFANAVNADRPSLWLNFNDATTAFKDQVSQGVFLPAPSSPALSIPSGNVGFWALNEGSGTTAVDSSATADNGTWSGTANCAGTYYTPSAIGAYPGGYSGCFTSTTATVAAPNNAALQPTAAVTLAGWYTLQTNSSSSNLGGMSWGGTAPPWQSYGLGTYLGKPYMNLATSTTAQSGCNSATVLAANIPYFLAVTYDGSNMRIYINGALNTTCAHTGSIVYSSPAGVFYVGGFNQAAVAANVMVYNVALTGTQLMSLYNSGINSAPPVPLQPGFDATNNNNFSAEFPFDGYMTAPNNTMGSIEWNVPWTMLKHIDHLNWDHTGTLVLASKGDISSYAGNWWKLFLQQNTGNANASQLCFERNGSGAQRAQQAVCTANNYDAMPNGFNYDIVIEDSGTGQPSALSMWVNGLFAGGGVSNTYASGFGSVALAVTAGGSGYAATTNFTSSGGGANCVVTGMASATSGVITSILSNTGNVNAGCTSNPTIVLTSPTGTGATFAATAAPMSMNSTTAPLMVPGYLSNGAYYGVGGTDATQNPVYADEFAIFPGNLTFGQISNLFYTTKFYQSAVDSATQKPVVILEDDTYDDPDNEFTLEMVIGLHRAGLITLAGVVVEDYTPAGIAGWRQMLDAAGLNDVPVSIPNVNPGSSGYGTGNITAYNASTPLTLSAWEDSTVMERKIFAQYPTRPIKLIQGSPTYYSLATFMQSPADSISPLTGLQMMAQNAANAGGLYIQGAVWDNTASGAYVVQNLQGTSLYAIGGTPMSGGPGALSTRTSNDPLYRFFTGGGTDVRQCYDCLTIETAVSSLFDFGVQVTYSGGTGYANATPFRLSGGGPHCQGSGIMTAASGVPNGIEFSWGASAVGAYSGIGSGCTSVPTVNLIGATGTGVTLTATPSPCGTIVPTLSGSTYSYAFSTATCSNMYSTPGSFNTDQSAVSGSVMTWFINSLVDAPPGGAPRTP